MSKTETIDTVARSAEISKAVAERVVEAFEARLKAHGDAGKRIVIRGFGSFSRACRARRPGAIRAPASRSLTPRTTSRRTSRRWPNRACAARLPPTRKSAKPPPNARWTPCKPPSPSVCAYARMVLDIASRYWKLSV